MDLSSHFWYPSKTFPICSFMWHMLLQHKYVLDEKNLLLLASVFWSSLSPVLEQTAISHNLHFHCATCCSPMLPLLQPFQLLVIQAIALNLPMSWISCQLKEDLQVLSTLGCWISSDQGPTRGGPWHWQRFDASFSISSLLSYWFCSKYIYILPSFELKLDCE